MHDLIQIQRYHELLRISGEMDKQKVWGSAAKFELLWWSNSTDKVKKTKKNHTHNLQKSFF
jgi:hypothetical protein